MIASALCGRRLIARNDTLHTMVMSSSIFVRLTPEAKHVLAVAAAKKGLSPAAFTVRQTALEAAMHMGSELEPVEETLASFFEGRESVIKMRPVIRASDVLQPTRPMSRPLLRADIERAALLHQPAPVAPTVDDVDISAFIQWQSESVRTHPPDAEQNREGAADSWDPDDEPY